MLRHTALREVIRTNFFGPVAGANLAAALLRFLVLPFFQLHIVEL